MASTFALNVLQTLDHCFTATITISKGVSDSENRFIFIDKGAFGKQSDGGTIILYRVFHDFRA